MTSPELPRLPLFIAGRWIDGGDRPIQPVFDPASGERCRDMTWATDADLDEALHAAHASAPAWRATPAAERAGILLRAAALIRERAPAMAHVLTREQGKPTAEAMLELELAAGVTEWNAQECTRLYGRVVPPRRQAIRQLVLKEPVGGVAAFTPWNFPAMMPARKISAALAAGCTCVIKPSEETPGAAIEIARAYADAGLPAGVLNVVYGVPADVSARLIRSPVIRKVAFTGSVPVGSVIGRLAGECVKPATLELGGHAPVLVFDDVDVDAVARLSAQAKFRNAGQICVAPTRFHVHARIYERFIEAFSQAASALRLGHGLDTRTTMGPLANARRVAAMKALVADARDQGARLVLGGQAPERPGNFFEPTLLADVAPAMCVMREEPFGPLAVAQPFDDDGQAIAQANALPYGLAAYVFTRDADRAVDAADAIESGMVGLNTYAIASPETPFGGVKDSGHGSEGGIEGVADFLSTKFVAQGRSPVSA